jgi:cyclopropane-fatty-acyl-phospholipid synthase
MIAASPEAQARQPRGPADERAVGTARAILKLLFGPPSRRAFAVRFWNGRVEELPFPRIPRFTVILRKPGALRRMLLPPSELALGEAYLRDDFDVEGDLEGAVSLAETISGRLRSPATAARLLALLLALPTDDLGRETGDRGRAAPTLSGERHSRSRDATAVRFHYDVSNAFYQLWLDEQMVYSCAYFETEADGIDTAQRAKLEHICRKLRLKAGERLLDIGCGWGGLVQYAAREYGVQALGITLSEPQARLARERTAAAGLQDRCRVEVRDYRDLPRGSAFDKIVSVGMFEHVGRARLGRYFGTAYRLLRPGGLFLNHGIVNLSPNTLAARLLWRQGSFIQRYVFPDGELVQPGEVLRVAEHAGFETRDLESLREHYVLTLRHWVRRLEGAHEQAASLAGETAYRVWRLYMAGSAHALATGGIGIVQILLAKPAPDGSIDLPLTRADLYARRDEDRRVSEA